MRTIKFNGYIDEEVWWGDEITPSMLHDQLYGENGDLTDDVSILVNSYGGSCNAATQMFDDINAYPGKVTVKISGTAASAATVFIQAADVVEITQGSLMMIHDPSTIAFGNEADMDAAKDVLKACKQAILNCYAVRAKASREELSDMMTKTTWLDANEALKNGLVDAITPVQGNAPTNSGDTPRVNQHDAEEKVKDWLNRRTPASLRNHKQETEPTPVLPPKEPEPEQEAAPVFSVDTMKKRLHMLK